MVSEDDKSNLNYQRYWVVPFRPTPQTEKDSNHSLFLLLGYHNLNFSKK